MDGSSNATTFNELFSALPWEDFHTVEIIPAKVDRNSADGTNVLLWTMNVPLPSSSFPLVDLPYPSYTTSVSWTEEAIERGGEKGERMRRGGAGETEREEGVAA